MILSTKIKESRDCMKMPKWLDFNNSMRKEPLYVIGHKHPDADSIFSSYILTRILNSMNILSVFAILENEYDFCAEDKNLILDYLPESPLIITDLANKNFLLVDHNDPNQSVGEANIIGCFDHHINSQKINNIVESEHASTLLLIYDIFKSDYEFGDNEKQLVALSVMADTEYLKSTRFKEQDKKLYESLNTTLNVDELNKKYFVTTPFAEPIEKIFLSNYKVYNMNDLIIHKVAFKTYHSDIEHFDSYIQFLKKQDGLWILIWSEYDIDHSYVVVSNYHFCQIIEYDFVVTSAVMTIKDLLQKGILR